MIEYSAEAIGRDAASIEQLAEAEGLDAHARSAGIRRKDES
jgi:histidinol dehydrogenase